MIYKYIDEQIKRYAAQVSDDVAKETKKFLETKKDILCYIKKIDQEKAKFSQLISNFEKIFDQTD